MCETEWFQDSGVDEQQPVVAVAWRIWAVAIVVAIVVPLLAACAASPSTGICGYAPIGEDENGTQFFRYYCRPG